MTHLKRWQSRSESPGAFLVGKVYIILWHFIPGESDGSQECSPSFTTNPFEFCEF